MAPVILHGDAAPGRTGGMDAAPIPNSSEGRTGGRDEECGTSRIRTNSHGPYGDSHHWGPRATNKADLIDRDPAKTKTFHCKFDRISGKCYAMHAVYSSLRQHTIIYVP
uniref:Uncharacterized protein n=1 Tax=Magallana gigas TaxID=29159 RepID=K1QG57_MAGGI